MECPRCHGIMIEDLFEDLMDDTGSLHFTGWRCLACGEILDPLIALRRGAHREPLQGRARKKFAVPHR